MVAVSVLPVNQKTIVFGSNDGGKTIHCEDEDVKGWLDAVAAKLFLAEHEVGPSKVLIPCPADLEVHRGTDGRVYCLDYSRVLPPENCGSNYEHLFQLFRTEFLQVYQNRLSSDAFSKFQSVGDLSTKLNDDATKAHLFLQNVLLPAAISNIANSYNTEGVVPLSDCFHRNGINMRYLGMARDHLWAVMCKGEEAENLAWMRVMHDIEIEACSRAVKVYWRKRLRALSNNKDSFVLAETTAVLNLAFGKSENGEKIWETEISPILVRNFGMEGQSFDQRRPLKAIPLAKLKSLQRFCKMTGVRLQPSMWQSLKQFPASFEQEIWLDRYDIKKLKPRVKHSNIVQLAKGMLYMSKGLDPNIALHSQARFFELAIKHLNTALSADPSDVNVLLQQGQNLLHYLRLLQKNEITCPNLSALKLLAEECFFRASEVDPNNAQVFFEYARFLDFLGDVDADFRFAQALLLDPNSAEMLREYGLFLSKKGNPMAEKFMECSATAL